MGYALAVAAIVGAAILCVAVRAWVRARGPRVVTCPDNQRPAGVELDARRAAARALIGGPILRLDTCSRWPEKAGCGQECLAQIESSPDGCLVRSILTDWFAGKTCVRCGRAIAPVRWTEWKPALVAPDGSTVDWERVVPDELPELLATHAPVCFDCHVAATLRREHPNLVVDR